MILSKHFRVALITAITTLIAGCGGSAEPEVAEEIVEIPKYNAAAFFATTSYGLASSGGYAFAPDNSKLLIYSDESGIFNVYALPADGGEALPLTQSDSDAMFGESWFPNDERIIFSFDNGGNELDHVVVRELDGSFHDLTPGEELKASFFGWSGDVENFYITSTERDPSSFDLYRFSSGDYGRELLFENQLAFQIDSLSRDGRWLALSKRRTSAASNVYIVDLSTADKEPVLISEHEGNISYGPPRPGDVPRSLADISQARHKLGYEPRVMIEEGLQRVALWFRKGGK